MLAELVREQVLARTREEVPHAVEVEVQEIEHPRPDLVRIEAVVLTETESQKGILIGAGGRMIKSIGVAARRAIERELGTKVHLRAVGQGPPALARRRACARPAGHRIEVLTTTFAELSAQKLKRYVQNRCWGPIRRTPQTLSKRARRSVNETS